MARLVEDGLPMREGGARFHVSWLTVKRRVDRYLAGESRQDRSSRPKTLPNKTSKLTAKWCVRLREGPVQLAARLRIAATAVHHILVAARLNRLSHVDRATDEPIRRYEHPLPGALVPMDVKKLGNIPDGGGWRDVGRKPGGRNRAATPGMPRSKWRNPKMGYAFVHPVLDDHSRVAYTEIHDDETANTAAGVLRRTVKWLAERSVTVECVLSDNGGAYRSIVWRDTCEALSIRPKYTRPYRPQTNGKVERFHRTMADGWAYARCYQLEAERRHALDAWLHHDNHHRPHTARANQPPFSRLINVPGQYTWREPCRATSASPEEKTLFQTSVTSAPCVPDVVRPT